MSKFNELLDSLNEENVSEVREKLRAEGEAKDNSNKQLYSRAKKAEGFENKDGKWVKKEKPAKPETKEKPEAKQSDEPDYGKLAYLETKGVSHPDDIKVVLAEANRLKLPVSDVLGMAHIKGQLKDAKNQRDAESGMPEGGGGKSGGNKDSVDYWLNKKDKDGNYITPTNVDLAGKVIAARVKSEEKQNMFSDELYTG